VKFIIERSPRMQGLTMLRLWIHTCWCNPICSVMEDNQ